MLDEKALRRPEFVEGVPIVLDDGQAWHFPKPRVRFALDRAADGPGIRFVHALGPAFEGALGDYRAWAAGGVPDPEADGEPAVLDHGARRVRCELALAHALLTRNYGLGDEQFDELVQFEYGPGADPGNTAMRQAILDVALGLAPKASPAGPA